MKGLLSQRCYWGSILKSFPSFTVMTWRKSSNILLSPISDGKSEEKKKFIEKLFDILIILWCFLGKKCCAYLSISICWIYLLVFLCDEYWNINVACGLILDQFQSPSELWKSGFSLHFDILQQFIFKDRMETHHKYCFKNLIKIIFSQKYLEKLRLRKSIDSNNTPNPIFEESKIDIWLYNLINQIFRKRSLCL